MISTNDISAALLCSVLKTSTDISSEGSGQ